MMETLVNYIVFIMEMIGILIIIIAGIKSLYYLIKGGLKFNNLNVSLTMAEGLNLSLGFLLAAEITSSIVIRTIPNLVILIGIAALRVGLTFVLHWEISEYEKVLDEDHPKGAYYKNGGSIDKNQ